MNRMNGIQERLLEAAAEGDVELVRNLIMSGAKVNFEIERIRPLQRAVEKGHLSVARVLLLWGADPNIRDPNGSPLLCIAAELGDEKIVELLIDSEADVNAKRDVDNLAPFSIASLRGHCGVAGLLLGPGADANARSTYGKTPLLAVEEERYDISELQLEAGAAVGAKGKGGQPRLVKLLPQYDATLPRERC